MVLYILLRIFCKLLSNIKDIISLYCIRISCKLLCGIKDFISLI